MNNKSNIAFPIAFAFLLIALIIAALAGCDDGDFFLSVNQNVDGEKTATKNSGDVINICSEAYYCLVSIASGYYYRLLSYDGRKGIHYHHRLRFSPLPELI
jgi:hypothetical protein